jgi:signal transduction histidine kinase
VGAPLGRLFSADDAQRLLAIAGAAGASAEVVAAGGEGPDRAMRVEILDPPPEAVSPVCVFRLADASRAMAKTSPRPRRASWALSAYARSLSVLWRHDGVNDLAQRVCEAVVQHDDYVLALVGLADPFGDKAVAIIARAGRAGGYADGLRLSWSEATVAGRGPTGVAIRSGEPYVVRDIFTDPLFAPWREAAAPFGIRSSVTAPFRQSETLVGMLIVYASEPDAFDQDSLNVFSLLGGQVALAMSLEQERARTLAAEAARTAAEDAARETAADLTRVARASVLGELASSIAHEIAQPLAAILMNSTASLNWLSHSPPDLEEARTAIQRTIRNADHGRAIVDSLRGLLAKTPLKPARFDANTALDEVLLFARGALRRDEISLRVDRARDLPLAWGDRIQVQQVIMNLVLNALDALREAPSRPRRLTARTGVTEAGEILIEVEDNGPGIEPTVAARLFDRFFTTKSGGTGVGLAISRSIAEAHRGRLWASSAEPHGAIFHFALPAAGAQAP